MSNVKKVNLVIRGESLHLIEKVMREMDTKDEVAALTHILSVYKQVDQLRDWDGSLTAVKGYKVIRVKFPKGKRK